MPVDSSYAEEALATLLTVESLLFATFGIAIGLSAATQVRRSLVPLAKRLAFVGAIVLTLIAITAGLEWWQSFITGDHLSVEIVALAIGSAAGLVAPPGFAWLIARALAR